MRYSRNWGVQEICRGSIPLKNIPLLPCCCASDWFDMRADGSIQYWIPPIFIFYNFGDCSNSLSGQTHGSALQNKSYIVFICAFLCFGCLGAIRLINFNMPAKNDIRLIAKEDLTFAHIKGQIISEPRIVENNDWHFAKFFTSAAYTTFLINVSECKKTENRLGKSQRQIKILCKWWQR